MKYKIKIKQYIQNGLKTSFIKIYDENWNECTELFIDNFEQWTFRNYKTNNIGCAFSTTHKMSKKKILKLFEREIKRKVKNDKLY